MSAAEMVRHRVCTAMCLLAVDAEATSCSCSCKGKWHGAMGSWVVPGTAGLRVPLEPAQPGRDLLDELAEVARAINDVREVGSVT